MSAGDDHPTTEELRAVQLDRLEEEQARADEAAGENPRAERTHGRRADRAAYLAEKLDEQAEAHGE